MSDIEICSKFKGSINITTKAGEQRTITFEDKGEVGYAKVKEDEAEIFLSIPGEYWKPGANEDAVAAALANDPEAAAAAAKLFTKKAEGEKTVKEIVELLAQCETVEAVDELVAGDERKGVIKAAEERKKELAA